MREDDLNVTVFQNRNWCSPKSDWWLFSNFDRQRTLGEGNVGTGLISEKAETMHVELKERVEAATNSYSAAAEFLQYIYLVLAAKNH